MGLQKKKPIRRQKKKPANTFDADKVFVSSKSEELEFIMKEDISRYIAKSGEGGDRRA